MFSPDHNNEIGNMSFIEVPDDIIENDTISDLQVKKQISKISQLDISTQ